MQSGETPQVVTLGETMAAFSPGSAGALRYVSDYRLRMAGAESNLAVGLAKLGVPVRWLSRLGEDEFGHYVLGAIRGEGVDCSRVVLDSDHRTGVMFKQTGTGETSVFYYREHSAASFMSPGDWDADDFHGARILHLTGITPVLSDSCRETVEHAASLARAEGMEISFDPNIRRKLWGGRDHTGMLRVFTLEADIVLLGLDEGRALFGSRGAEELADTIFSHGRARLVAVKHGAEGAWVADRTLRAKVEPFACRCVEPIGAGDAFNAAFLVGVLGGRDVLRCGKMGCIAGGLATTTVGDIEGYPDRAGMERILAGEEETAR